MKEHKTVADILSRPSFLCMSCDNETDYKLCDECEELEQEVKKIPRNI